MIRNGTRADITMLGLRWIARAGSLLSIGLIFLFFIGGEFHPAKITPREWVGLTFFPVGVVAGMIIAWWKEGVGAGITLSSLLAFYGVYGFLLGSPIGFWFIVFASPGFFFLLYWILSRSKLATAAS
jgi:hypothetical protein